MFCLVKPSKKIGLFLWKIFDVKLIDGFGPDGISSVIKNLSIKAVKFQSGFIYQYAFIMLIGFSVLLTIFFKMSANLKIKASPCRPAHYSIEHTLEPPSFI